MSLATDSHSDKFRGYQGIHRKTPKRARNSLPASNSGVTDIRVTRIYLPNTASMLQPSSNQHGDRQFDRSINYRLLSLFATMTARLVQHHGVACYWTVAPGCSRHDSLRYTQPAEGAFCFQYALHATPMAANQLLARRRPCYCHTHTTRAVWHPR